MEISKGTRPVYKWLAIIFGIFIILGFIGALSSGSPSSNSVATPNTLDNTTPSPSPIAQACQSFASSSVQTISYKQLGKNPDSFQGKNAMFTGQVVQIQESGSEGQMRLVVDKDAYGNWNTNDVVLVLYSGHTEAVQDDVVTVSGVMQGSQTYTSVANYQITVPLMYGCSIKEGSAKIPPKSATVAPAKVSTAVSQTSAPTASGSTANFGSQSVAPVPTGSWHTVATFNGSGDTNTDTFLIKGSKWRIDWGFAFPPANASFCQQNGCNLTVEIFKSDGTDVDSFLETGQQPSSGTVNEYGSTSNMYLRVISGNVTWNLTVEDYY